MKVQLLTNLSGPDNVRGGATAGGGIAMAHTSLGVEWGSFYERSGRARPAVYERHKRGLPTCERPARPSGLEEKKRYLRDLALENDAAPARQARTSSLAEKRRHIAALEAEMARPLESHGQRTARGRIDVQQERRRLQRLEQENNRKCQHERLQSGLPVGDLRWNGERLEAQWQERSALSGW